MTSSAEIYFFINSKKELRDLLLSNILSDNRIKINIATQNSELQSEILKRTGIYPVLFPDFMHWTIRIVYLFSLSLMWRNRERSQSHLIRAGRLIGNKREREIYSAANNGRERPFPSYFSFLVRALSVRPFFDVLESIFYLCSKFESRKFSNTGRVCVIPYSGELGGRFDLLVSSLKLNAKTTVAYQSNWDNLSSKAFIHSAPHYFGVWSAQSKSHIGGIQRLTQSEILVLGSPRFAKHFAAKDEGDKRNKISKNKSRLIIFASNGLDDHTDALILKELSTLNRDEFQILYRPHPFSRSPLMDPHKYYEDSISFAVSKDSIDDHGLDFLNKLQHADLLISQLSTLCLEARILNVPVLLPLFSSNNYAIDFQDAYHQLTHFSGFQALDGVCSITKIDELVPFMNSFDYSKTYYSQGTEWFCSSVDFANELTSLLIRISK